MALCYLSFAVDYYGFRLKYLTHEPIRFVNFRAKLKEHPLKQNYRKTFLDMTDLLRPRRATGTVSSAFSSGS